MDGNWTQTRWAPAKIPTMGRVKPQSADNGCGYEHLSAYRVWGRALKLLPTRVRAFFTNEGMGMGTIVPYPLDIHYQKTEWPQTKSYKEANQATRLASIVVV
ncbi:hypothetical protein MTR_4g060490 [Medicago truncatula]|uniref:Uncharacterized protein n=1 Tax=Medicago truncatula TaxID=3880 RepID=G7JQF9_MEDTR|nr:hypothetical protein MTR_4g060490 [Medicago truncatula]